MPREYYSSLKPKDFSDVLSSPACTLQTFRRAAGDEKTKSVVVLILTDLVEFFNVGNSMNARQIVATAEIVLDAYGWLKVDDFKLCFDWAKRGLFGQVYRMDGNVILSWVEQYIADRTRTSEENSYARHSEVKAAEKRQPTFHEVVEMVQKASNKFKFNDKK